jgi:hypothetical protein
VSFTQEYLFPCRSNSPSTAAAPPPAAANTGNGCAKMPFFRFLPQLSSLPGSDFSQNGLVKLTNLQNFTQIHLDRREYQRFAIGKKCPIAYAEFDDFCERYAQKTKIGSSL